MGPLGNLKQILTQHKASITRPRIRVFEILASSETPLTTRQILERAPDLDKVSVYRTIDLFEKIGISKRVWNGFKSSIELSDAFSPHHHHFNCIKCGAIQSIESPRIEETLLAIEKEYGFELQQHTVELRGLCQACRPSSETAHSKP